jgi:hypothetical protein
VEQIDAWRGSCSGNPRVPPTAPTPPAVLLLARPGPETDDLFADLDGRDDLCLLRAATAAAAARAIEEMPVALLVACPETPSSAIDAAVEALERSRAGTPVLALRARRAPEPAGWKARGVAVLRLPLLAGVLSRTVDVVLGMSRGPKEARKEGR